MNINKALEHFQYKFKNNWKPTQKDIEAYNAIVEYRELQDSLNMSKNESLAKLWIHQIILLARTNMYNGERCIQVIDEILSKSTYEWALILKEEIPMMRFNNVGLHKYREEKKNVYNRSQIIEINNKIIEEFETELTKTLITPISEENIIKFIEQNITRIINKFEK